MQSNDLALLGQSPRQLLETLPARVSAPLFRHARETPRAPAIRDHLGRCCDYAELAERVQRTVDWLRERGVRAGDRVMLINENCLTVAVLILALSEAQAWPVVVNARMSASELARIGEHCRPRLSVYLLESVAAAEHWANGGTGETEECDGAAVGVVRDRTSAAETDPRRGNERVFTLLYTTGTTGAPKGVMLSHRNILYVAAVTSALRGMRAGDRIYAVLPVSHVFGLAAVFLATLYKGAELVMADRFDAGTALETLRGRAITGLFGVPAMFSRLRDHMRREGLSGDSFPALRFLYSGGAPLEPQIKRDTEAAFGMPLLNAYGMTECGPTICQVRYNRPLPDCSVGPPLPGLGIRIVDDDGNSVTPGAVGELHVQGPNVMLGYYRNPQATADIIDGDGFLNTGDMVWQDEAGSIHIAGRSKELIIRSGFNVFPPEVEAQLMQHPEVLLCAVVGRVCDGNEQVVAYVQTTAGSRLDEDSLLAYIAPHLAGYKRPSRIVFVEELPTAPSGKVLKHRLG